MSTAFADPIEPCVWCGALTVGRNETGEPVCGDFDCQKDDHKRRLRKENP